MAITKVSASLVDLDGGVVINESSADADFRVESNGKTHMLFVDGGNDRVGVGAAPSSPFSVSAADGTLANFTNASNADFQFKTASAVALLTPSTGTLAFGTSDTERMRINSSGLVSIGTTTTDRELKVQKSSDHSIIAAVSGTSSLAGMVMGDTDDDDIGAVLYNNNGNYLYFQTNTSERARFTSAGKILIGTSSAVRGSEQVSIDGGSADCFALKTHAAGAVVRKQSVTNGFIFLFENSSASAVGSITTDASNTTYNTSSDYRLKENIEPMQNGLDRLQQLNPVKFTWKETGIESEGFIAHEVDEVFSDCIYGEKDGDEIQSMDYGRITPLLVKAVQELTAEVEELKTKLESK